MQFISSSRLASPLTADANFAVLTPDHNSLTNATRPVTQSSSITFIDRSVPNYELLRAGQRSGTEVHILDSSQDAIAQITGVLAGRKGITDLNIISHGEIGSIDFASMHLNQKNLSQYTTDFKTWAEAFTEDADILLYGCDIAQGMAGESFVKQLSELTGADVAASDDLTGSAKLGGDWDLEYQTGKIEAPKTFLPWVQSAYEYTLATFTVTNTNDSGVGSLRQAVLDANATAGADEIVFQLGSGSKTITLTSGQLDITDNVFISGLGRNKLTVSGNNSSRVFQINSGVSAALTEMTVANGQNNDGGGIVNLGRLDIRNSAFRSNNSQNGGAILNGSSATGTSTASLTVDNVQFTNNIGTSGGAIRNFATATIRNSTFNNNEAIGGGGISSDLSAMLLIERSTFNQNKAYVGGAISNNASLTIRSSTFNGNTAQEGGGIYNFGSLTISDSTFKANTAATNGGGILNAATAIISYSKFQSNTAAGEGGAIYHTPYFGIETLTIEFNEVKDNRAANGGGVFTIVPGKVRVKKSKIFKNTATIAGSDLSGGFISEGGNKIGNASGSTGFVNRVLGDRIG